MFSRRHWLRVLLVTFISLFFVGNTSFASTSAITLADPATATMRLLIDSGNEQSILAYSNSRPIELKLVDLEENPVVGGIVDLLVVNRPSAAKTFKLPATSIKSNPVGIIRIETFSPSEAGSYRIMAQLRENPAVYTYIDFNVNEENWVMYLIFGLLGGLGMFLFGMNLGADGLQKIAGKKMKSILGTFTNNRYMGVLTGILVTAVTQSSSATTVMLVGFVNASLMTISQTLSVIFGANIGTTITVQLIAFEISHFALLMIGAGFILKFSRNKTVLYAGDIIMGFGFIFYGMKIMSVSMSPLRSFPAFREMLLSFSNYPISAIIGSMLFTALIQSSGATIGLVVVFASQGLITLHASIPLILGAHTGTCITGWIAALGASAAAKKNGIAQRAL